VNAISSIRASQQNYAVVDDAGIGSFLVEAILHEIPFEVKNGSGCLSKGKMLLF